jgi:hypothetical protein
LFVPNKRQDQRVPGSTELLYQAPPELLGEGPGFECPLAAVWHGNRHRCGTGHHCRRNPSSQGATWVHSRAAGSIVEEWWWSVLVELLMFESLANQRPPTPKCRAILKARRQESSRHGTTEPGIDVASRVFNSERIGHHVVRCNTYPLYRRGSVGMHVRRWRMQQAKEPWDR